MTRLAILISGFGSNLQAIIDEVEAGKLPNVEIAVVVSNKAKAYGLERARQHGIPTEIHLFRKYRALEKQRDAGAGKQLENAALSFSLARRAYDADLAALLERYQVEWVILAGWMRLLTMAFLERFPNRVINLHPARPGAFPGPHAIERAFEAYQRGEIDGTGVMVHLVPDEAVDAGPVILAEDVPIFPDDTLETLEARIHAVEHRLLPEAIRKMLGQPATHVGDETHQKIG